MNPPRIWKQACLAFEVAQFPKASQAGNRLFVRPDWPDSHTDPGLELKYIEKCRWLGGCALNIVLSWYCLKDVQSTFTGFRKKNQNISKPIDKYGTKYNKIKLAEEIVLGSRYIAALGIKTQHSPERCSVSRFTTMFSETGPHFTSEGLYRTTTAIAEYPQGDGTFWDILRLVSKWRL